MKLLRKTNLLLRVYIYGAHFILRSGCLRKETMNNRSIVTENTIKEGKRVLFFHNSDHREEKDSGLRNLQLLRRLFIEKVKRKGYLIFIIGAVGGAIFLASVLRNVAWRGEAGRHERQVADPDKTQHPGPRRS